MNRQVHGHPPLGGLSQPWLMQEFAILYNLPPVVKLGGERGPIGLNILVVQIPADGRQRDVDMYAAYSDMVK